MYPINEEDNVLIAHPPGIPLVPRDRRSLKEKQIAVNFILIVTFLERVTFNAFTISLFAILVLKEGFYWRDQHSKTAAYIFIGISYSSTILFAIISDWKLGRAKIIVIGFFLDLIGLIIIGITSTGKTILCHFDPKQQHTAITLFQEKCAPTVLSTLILTALGAAAIKSNLVVFGAEQNQDKESRPTSRYFENYVLATNIGGIIAILIVPYIQTILSHDHYYILYIVVIVLMLITGILFCIGWRYYLHVPTNESVIFNVIPVLYSACRSWYAFKRQQYLNNQRQKKSKHPTGTQMRDLNNLTTVDDIDESITIRQNLPSILDYARIQYGGRSIDRHVNEVKALRSAVLVFILLIPFWLIENQTESSFQSQGQHMSRPVSKPYVITWMSLGDPVIVSIGIGIFYICIYKYYAIRHESSWIAKKLIVGMIFAALSMLVAGVVEVFRQKQCIGNSPDSALPIYIQLVQTILIGFSQLFGMIASYEYAYFAAPRSGQSLFMSLYYSSAGISFLIGTVYFNVFPRTDIYIDFDCQSDTHWFWSFYTYFFIMCAAQIIFLIIFFLCHIKYQLVKLNRQQLDNSTSHS